jgi:hypothetical protein
MNYPIYFKTPDNITTNIVLGTTKESLYLDFKRELSFDKDSAYELALDICSFANSEGGSIIIGIEEDIDPNDKCNVAKSFLNVNNVEDIERFINDQVSEYIYPAELKYECKPLKINDNSLLSINVYPLEKGIAAVSKKSEPQNIKFPYRTDYGKKYMKPYQVDERNMSNSRSLFLRMKRLNDKCKGVVLHSPVYLISNEQRTLIKNTDVTITKINESEFNLFFSGNPGISGIGINVFVPFSLLFDIWEMDYNKMGVILRANILLDTDTGNSYIEPLNI